LKFNAALAQMYPKLGDLRMNVQKHITLMEEARARGADLIVFPELSLTGYFLQDLLYELACEPTATDRAFGPLLEASARLDLDAVVGFVECDPRGLYYNAAAYLAHGEVVHVHRKVYLPTYGMFIDGRFFSPGDKLRAFETRFGRACMLICEDFWHVSAPYLLWLDGADLLLFPTASPGRGLTTAPELGSAAWGQTLAQTYAGLFGSVILYANRVGVEDGITFFGGSMVADADGSTRIRAPQYDEALIVHPVDMNAVRRNRTAQPLLRDERRELVQRELARILSKETGEAW